MILVAAIAVSIIALAISAYFVVGSVGVSLAPAQVEEGATSVVFLGDSLTEEGNWSAYFGKSTIKNRGIGGDRTYNVLSRLDGVIRLAPEKLFLMVGVNDLGEGRKIPEIVADYSKILERITKELPAAKVFVQSALPISTRRLDGAPDTITNARIMSLNQELKKLAQQYKMTYIDLYPLMLNQRGDLMDDATYDGLHLSAKGYKIWMGAVAQYVREGGAR